MVQKISAGITCHSCGKDTLYVGKLPAIGVHAAVHVFKCETCLTIRETPAGTGAPTSAQRSKREMSVASDLYRTP
jgi:hypothetical protein